MTRLWFTSLVVWANRVAWTSSIYDYRWEPAVGVMDAIRATGAPSETTMRKVLRYGVRRCIVDKHGDYWRPWPLLDDLSRIGTWPADTVEEYAQIAEYIATNMDQQYAPSVDAWARRAAAARAVLQRRAA